MAVHIGNDFTPPDIYGKVTGGAKYAEDIHVEGMVYARVLHSPLPHARVLNIDASAVREMDGVVGILTADDVPEVDVPQTTMLTNNPVFVGDPILAVAAITEEIATDALGKIRVDYERLPFCTDPLDSLMPGGPEARAEGNMFVPAFGPAAPPESVKWSADEVAAFRNGEGPPERDMPIQWNIGDIDTGFANATHIVEDSFVTAGYAHHSMEPRSAMAYWQNGKCYLHGPSQSQTAMMPGMAAMIGVDLEDLVYINEYCGGGFGSRSVPYPMLAVPAYFSRKINRPVAMHLSRAQEFYNGKARAGFQGHVKIGFRDDGRITAMDLFILQDVGCQTGFPSAQSAAGATSLVYQPEHMRFRALPILTNTTPKGAQRGPGQNQIASAIEPLIDRAARELDIDRVQIRILNAPDNDALHGPGQEPMTSAYIMEALATGAERFDWDTRRSRSGTRRGSKVIGVGVGQAYHSAGRDGYDGLIRITPDGRIHLHSGVGNLGTYSYASTTRPAAELLKCDWQNCVIHHGKSTEHLPWSSSQNGSNTTFTHTRANYVAAQDILQKLKQIAMQAFGGAEEDFDVEDERVFLLADPSKSMSFADAARIAIDLGGHFDGSEMPDDIHAVTRLAVSEIKGTGLVGVAKDTMGKRGAVPGLAIGFIEIELDTETGKIDILDYIGVADCGIVVHPMGLAGQIRSGAVWGFGMGSLERHVYDPRIGVPANVGFHECRLPTYLDIPREMQWDAVNLPDRDNPVGAKGIGEPVMGCASAALLCAISDALDGHTFNRVPVSPDMIVNHVAGRPDSTAPMAINTF